MQCYSKLLFSFISPAVVQFGKQGNKFPSLTHAFEHNTCGKRDGHKLQSRKTQRPHNKQHKQGLNLFEQV